MALGDFCLKRIRAAKFSKDVRKDLNFSYIFFPFFIIQLGFFVVFLFRIYNFLFVCLFVIFPIFEVTADPVKQLTEERHMKNSFRFSKFKNFHLRV